MTGIVPNASSGALIIGSTNVTNMVTLPATFTVSCPQLGLPNDCTAKITPAQINAMVSELMSLAACFAPDGTWTCTSLTNLCSAFNSYVDGTGLNTLQGDVLKALDWKDCAGNQHVATAIIPTCAEVVAMIAAQTPLIVSPEADNMIVEDAGGQAYLSPLQAVNAVLADVAAKCALTNGIQKDLSAVALGVGDVPFPVGTDNYGLRVSASPECELFVPYASDVNKGVIEFIDTIEASQDHNLPVGNVDTVAGAMSAVAQLDDLRGMTARRTLDFLQNNFYIQSNRVYNIPSARFPTLNSIELYLRDHYIAQNVTVTINVAAGTHVLTGPLAGHPQGNRISIVGAALLGTPAVTDITSTGSTAAVIAADYATSKAALAAKYATFVEASTVAGVIMNSQVGNIPYRWTNIYFVGQFRVTGATPLVGINVFTTCVIDIVSSVSAGLTLTGSPVVIVFDLIVISPTSRANITVSIGSGLFSFGTGVGLVCLGATLNIEVRRGSKLVIETNLSVFGATLSNMIVYETGSASFRGAIVVSNSAGFNIDVSEGSSVAYASGNLGVMTISNATLANVRVGNGSSFSSQPNNLYASVTITGAPIGVEVVRGGTAVLIATAFAVTNHTTAGVSSSQGVVALTPVAGVYTFTGNATDILASNSSDVLIGSLAAPTTSPPIGVVGNNNSIIHL
jgi:hypothetical protein